MSGTAQINVVLNTVIMVTENIRRGKTNTDALKSSELNNRLSKRNVKMNFGRKKSSD